MGYLLQQDVVTQDTLNKVVDEWRNVTVRPAYKDLGDMNPERLNRLLPLFDISFSRQLDIDFEKTYSALTKGQPEHAGSLRIIIYEIVFFLRTMMAWKRLNLKKDVSISNHPLLYHYRKLITKISGYLIKLEKLYKWLGADYSPHFWSIFEASLSSRVSPAFASLSRLFFANGYSFNEDSETERAAAIIWLQSIRDYCKKWMPINTEIAILIGENNYIVGDPYLDLYCGSLVFLKAINYLDELSGEFEQGSTNPQKEKAHDIPESVGGRKEGSWHTDENQLEDVIWEALFVKTWNAGLKTRITSYNFGNRTATKRMKDIPLLGAAHLYKALELNGLAKKYGEPGTKNAFYKTLQQQFGFRRQSLDDYMLLMNVVEDIDVAISNERLNDGYKNIGWEKTESGNSEDTSRVQGTKRIVTSNASYVWAVSLAQFRKEHREMYVLLGEDILSPSYTVEQPIDKYPNNNIDKMIKTTQWLSGELLRQYNGFIGKKKVGAKNPL